jgi:ATP-dependent exoDNAse (exonuclease V) alpha subunit
MPPTNSIPVDPAKPDIEVTPEYRQILGLLKDKTPVVFVTGKAGTGKTTFIQFLKETYQGDAVVVAPTGVAALNVGGATIHSFFRLPPRVVTEADIRRVRGGQVYRKLRLLVIDEVSMVRAEVIDAIDRFLQVNRDHSDPFGGVQVLMVGDLFQLPPVVPPPEREALRQMGYESPYFFSAKVFKDCPMVSKELTKIFRQTDGRFIDLLNRVRVAEDIEDVLPQLNARCRTSEQQGPILTLSCTNRVADALNDQELGRIGSPSRTYVGEVSGKFAVEEVKFPSPMRLSLKAGAQVMFTKNDDKKRWVNGTLGRVVELADDAIRVEIGEGAAPEICDVKPVDWETFKYEYDETEKRVQSVSVGSYRQFPLMLAWAVTIHKSQGKTLARVRVDLGQGAFDYGQVYVALSRCRSLADIHLVRPVRWADIKCDPEIKRFYETLSPRF